MADWPLGRGGSIDGVYIKNSLKKLIGCKDAHWEKKKLSRDKVGLLSVYFELGN